MPVEFIGVRDEGTFKISGRTAHDQETIDGIPIGKDFRCVVTFPRSLRQNRFYWALLGKVVENSDHYERSENLHLWLKVKLGQIDYVKFHDGHVLTQVSSTAFHSMDHVAFTEFLQSAIRLICTSVIPGMDSKALVREVEAMTSIRYRDITERKSK